MQKTLVKVMHRKIVFVNRASLIYLKAFIDLDAVTLLVLQTSEMKFYWDPKEQSTKQHPVNIRFTKQLVQHIREVWSF